MKVGTTGECEKQCLPSQAAAKLDCLAASQTCHLSAKVAVAGFMLSLASGICGCGYESLQYYASHVLSSLFTLP